MPHLFSIVTSAYNSQDFILKALESVKSQTYKDYEYIVIDNGSEDNTFKLINRFIKQNPWMDIKLYHVDKNLGISGGRNAGIDKASGLYICFLDADDYWYKNKLKEVRKAIEAHTEYEVFCHWENHIRDGHATLGRYRKIDNSDPYEDLLFNGNALSTSALAVKAEKLREIGGFNTGLKSGEEDFDCWLRLARGGASFFMIEKPLGAWLLRSNSISAKHVIHTDAVAAMLKPHFDYLYKQSLDKRKVKKHQGKVFARLYCGCARTLSLENKRKLAKKIYLRSLSYDKTYIKAYIGLILDILHL